jgi:hypothetical protein
VHLPDSVPGKTLAQALDNRKGARDRRLEGQNATVAIGHLRQSRSMMGKQGLVRGDDMLSRR